MKTKHFLMPLLALIIGCTSAPTDTPPEAFTPTSDKGLVIGTVTFQGDKPQNDIYRFFYNAKAGDKKFIKRNAGKIIIKAREDNTRNFNGDFNNKKTYLFVIEREPGTYAFTQYNYLTHIGPSGMVNSSGLFSIPFEVKKGAVSYIGEIQYNDVAQKGEPRIIMSDNMARDLPEFKKKFQGINWDTALNNTVKTGDSGNGIVEFK
jgi:hypothetical protein